LEEAFMTTTSSADATRKWRPNPGQIALVEPSDAEPGQECLTGVVVQGDRVTIDLGASPRPPAGVTDVVVSFFAPEALYRLTAKADHHGDGLLALDVTDVERIQRRNTPRVLMSLPIRLRPMAGDTKSSVLSGETLDVSAGGCRVTTNRPWSEDTDPILSIDLPDGESLVTEARVITGDPSGGGWEYRLAFPGIADIDRERLSRLVALGV
jgi:hypothetical protein